MKFEVKNLGKISKAEIELGDLTILCGQNNAGKSYLSYTIFSFINTISGNLIFDIEKKKIIELISTGSCVINFMDLWKQIPQKFKEILPAYSRCIPRFLAIHDQENELKSLFKFSDYDEWKKNFIEKEIENQNSPIIIGKDILLYISKTKNSCNINCTLEIMTRDFVEDEKLYLSFKKHFSFYVAIGMVPLIFGITGERSGISIFCDFLNEIARNRENDGNEKYTSNNKPLRSKIDVKLNYPLPLRSEVNFLLNIKEFNNRTTGQDKFNKILKMYVSIAGGKYSCDDSRNIHFTENNTSKDLLIKETSSSVKSLVDLYFYIKFIAQPGQILMIDEPELNLHPSNQRKMARLIVMLVNAGIKVLVTTHSDYIIRELSTLIMLNDDNKRIQSIAKKLKYDEKHNNCLLDYSKICCYVVKDGSTHKMNVSKEYGIEVTSFDDTINEINSLQREIIYGD